MYVTSHCVYVTAGRQEEPHPGMSIQINNEITKKKKDAKLGAMFFSYTLHGMTLVSVFTISLLIKILA